MLRPGVIGVGDREIPYERLMIATGSLPSIPPIDGLDARRLLDEPRGDHHRGVPDSLIVVGAGPVGCELAQFFRRMGSAVTIVDVADRLIPRDHADAAKLLTDAFTEEGIELRLGASIERVEPGVHMHLAGGETLDRRAAADRHRSPSQRPRFRLRAARADDFQARDRGAIAVCAPADNVWAAGDATGIAMFTHVGKYQARAAAADAAGRPAQVDYSAIPAVTFTDPQVGLGGRHLGRGHALGERTSVARLSTYERPKRPMLLKVFADPQRRVLVGAVAVGPEAGEWLGQLTLAIRAQVPIDVIADTIQPYPTFCEMHFAVPHFAVSSITD